MRAVDDFPPTHDRIADAERFHRALFDHQFRSHVLIGNRAVTQQVQGFGNFLFVPVFSHAHGIALQPAGHVLV